MKISVPILVLFSGLTFQTQAAIKESEIRQSILQSYPLLKKSFQDLRSKELSVQKNRGAFDMKLIGEHERVPVGYFERRYNSLRIEKPLRILGSKIYGGYSKGTGLFPPQFSTLGTNSGGSWSTGVSLSLWRNREWDEARNNLANSKLDRSIGQLLYDFDVVNMQAEGIKAFWNWMGALKVKNIYKELISLAQDRDKALVERVKKGDIPEIMLKENLQYLNKRKAEMANAEQNLTEATFQLSLYLMDKEGNSLFLQENESPIEFPPFIKVQDIQIESDIVIAKKVRPEISSARFEIEKAQNEVALSKNDLAPQLDIYGEALRNYGNEDVTNAPKVYTVGLRLEIPIERNLGKGAIGEARALLLGQEHKLRFLERQVEVGLRNQYSAIKLAIEKVEYSKNEKELAKDLSEAERFKFKNGASNFFLINLREEMYADAQVNFINSALEYLFTFTDYKASIMNLDAYPAETQALE